MEPPLAPKRRPAFLGVVVGAALALAALANSRANVPVAGSDREALSVAARAPAGGDRGSLSVPSRPPSNASHAAAVHAAATSDSSNVTTSVTVDSSARMVLQAAVSVELRGGSASSTYEVAIEYAPARASAASRLKPLWSASATLAASGDDGDDGVASAALSVYRLRPNTEYAFRVWLSVDGANATLAGSVSRTTPRTGHPRFDDAALATITGGVPSWELLTMAYDMETVGQAAQDFVGVVGVDQAGWVVWYYTANSETAAGGHMGIPAVWDFLPASKDYAMVLLQTGYSWGSKGASVEASDGERWAANSALSQVRVDGALEHIHVQACTGAPMNYNALSHELRVDHTAEGDERVLTTAYKMGFYAAVKLRVKKGLTESVNWRVDRFLGVGIDAWRPEEGTLEPLYDMFDFAAPDDATWAPETTTWTKQDVSCSGGVEIDALDYHHISAVSVGPSGDMLITSRNLNTIWCVDAKGGGGKAALKWTLSSLDGASDFAFERGLDMFYTPHNALELEDGRLLLIDDGSSRPGCFTSNALAGCWSRAAIYSLNQTAGTVALDWQFEDPYAANGGTSVAGVDPITPDNDDDDDASARSSRALRGKSGGSGGGGKSSGGKSDDDGGNNSGGGGGKASSSDDDDGGGGGGGKASGGRSDDDDGESDDGGGDSADAAESAYYLDHVMTRDSYNFDGGSAYRLDGGRVLVAFTSPYDNRVWNTKYSMRAYEIDKDGNAIVYITVPHDSNALESQGAYRFIPMKTVYGESSEAPFALS